MQLRLVCLGGSERGSKEQEKGGFYVFPAENVEDERKFFVLTDPKIEDDGGFFVLKAGRSQNPPFSKNTIFRSIVQLEDRSED